MPATTETIIEVREVICPAIPPRLSAGCPAGRAALTSEPDDFRELLANWIDVKARLQCAYHELDQWRGSYADCSLQ